MSRQAGTGTGPVATGPGWVARLVMTRPLATAGGMGALTISVLRHAFSPPLSWWRDAVVETSLAMRRTLVPYTIALSIYWYALAVIWFGNLIIPLGAVDRLPGALVQVMFREEGVWVSSMILAGIAGSGMCSDLGARKARGELDALAVLSIDATKSLVVPRVVGVAVASVVLSLIGVFIALAVTLLGSVGVHGVPTAVFFENVDLFTLTGDIVPYLAKMLVIGTFVGIVATYKGLTAGAGPAGVGRAVNESVLISFVGIWVFNVLSNFAVLALNPDLTVFRG